MFPVRERAAGCSNIPDQRYFPWHAGPLVKATSLLVSAQNQVINSAFQEEDDDVGVPSFG